jgi:tetratricopeptide (TPR) repeat protein
MLSPYLYWLRMLSRRRKRILLTGGFHTASPRLSNSIIACPKKSLNQINADIINLMNSASNNGLLGIALLISLLLITPLFLIQPQLSSSCREVLIEPYGVNEKLSDYQSSAAAAICLPWRTDLWESAAHLALQEEMPDSAARYLERARFEAVRFGQPANQTLSLRGLQDLAEAYRQTGELSLAIETWQEIDTKTGKTSSSTDRISRLFLAQGDFASAANIWEDLLELEPDNAEAQYQYASLLATQDPEAALPQLEQAARINPQLESEVSILRQAIMGARIAGDPAYTLINTGRAFASIDRWVLAGESFRQAILKRPDYAEAWAYLGEARQHIPQREQSNAGKAAEKSDGMVELQTALELDPESLSAQSFLALYWMRHSRYDQALEAIKKAVSLSPENPLLVADLADIQAASGDLYGAYDNFQKASALAPLDPSYPRRMVRFSLAYNFQVEQVALPLVRKLLAEDPQNPVDLDLMAQVMINQGDLASAERFLRRALLLNPRSASAHLHLGVLQLLQDDPQSALEQLQLALALDPDGSSGSEAQRMLDLSSP